MKTFFTWYDYIMTKVMFLIVAITGMLLFFLNNVRNMGLGSRYNELLRQRGLPAMPRPNEMPSDVYYNPLRGLSYQLQMLSLSFRLFTAKYPSDDELNSLAHQIRMKILTSICIAIGTLLGCVLVVLIFGPAPS